MTLLISIIASVYLFSEYGQQIASFLEPILGQHASSAVFFLTIVLIPIIWGILDGLLGNTEEEKEKYTVVYWECFHCHHVHEGKPQYCPNCGKLLKKATRIFHHSEAREK